MKCVYDDELTCVQMQSGVSLCLNKKDHHCKMTDRILDLQKGQPQ